MRNVSNFPFNSSLLFLLALFVTFQRDDNMAAEEVKNVVFGRDRVTFAKKKRAETRKATTNRKQDLEMVDQNKIKSIQQAGFPNGNPFQN